VEKVSFEHGTKLLKLYPTSVCRPRRCGAFGVELAPLNKLIIIINYPARCNVRSLWLSSLPETMRAVLVDASRG